MYPLDCQLLQDMLVLDASLQFLAYPHYLIPALQFLSPYLPARQRTAQDYHLKLLTLLETMHYTHWRIVFHSGCHCNS